jgi:hypothetical protein
MSKNENVIMHEVKKSLTSAMRECRKAIALIEGNDGGGANGKLIVKRHGNTDGDVAERDS